MAKVDTPSSKSVTESAAPSMEDILRTIRGVISGSAPEPVAVEEKSTEDNADDELELTEAVADDGGQKNVLDDIDTLLGVNDSKNPAPVVEEIPAAEEFAPIAEEIPVMMEEEEKEEEEITATPVVEPVAPPAEIPFEPEPLESPALSSFTSTASKPSSEERSRMSSNFLSEPTAKATRAAFEELVYKSPRPHTEAPVLRSGTSLEELVIEALRPYLMDWLDRNLPTVVKQLVEKEIRRLVPREPD